MNDDNQWLIQEKAEGYDQPLRLRTKAYALQIIRAYGSLPRSVEAQIIGKQLLRSGTSVGANYHKGHVRAAAPR